MTKIKTVCVDKVAYEAVLRNSVRVNDLEAKNKQLRELLYSLKCCLTSENIESQTRVEKSLAKIEEFLTNEK